MKFTFACKKVALNDSIKEYAEKKISKLDRYFPEEADAFVIFASSMAPRISPSGSSSCAERLHQGICREEDQQAGSVRITHQNPFFGLLLIQF